MMEFMEKIGVETMHVSNPKTAEMVKMADNLWIDQSIALGNQLALICEKLGIDVQEVIKAANTLPKGGSFVNILLPGLVGGSCLTKDPYFLANLATTKGIDSSLIIAGRKLNESMYLHVVDLVKEAYAEMGKALKGSKIAVLGLAFKGETSDIRESQAISIVRKLKELGADVKVFDPYVKDAPSDITMTSLDDALKGSDCIVVATEHSYFRQLQLEQLSNSVNKPSALVDARGVFNPSKAKNLGFIWRGLGRP
jgi:UDP-N-acetyl-D-mannosaminuronic acid dehydrogenase